MGKSNDILGLILADLECYLNDGSLTFEKFRQEPDKLDGRSDITGSRIALYEDGESVTSSVSKDIANTSEQSYNIDINAVAPYAGDLSADVEFYLNDLRDHVVEWAKNADVATLTNGYIMTFGYKGSSRTTRSKRYATKTLNFLSWRDLAKTQ